MKNNIKIRILIFYIIGISLSNVFRFDLLKVENTTNNVSVLQLLLTYTLGAIGLLIGAIISINLLKKQKNLEYGIFGTSKKWSLIMLTTPIILLGVFGVKNVNGIEVHYYGIIGAVGTLIYCYFEEIGWRGYLNAELKSIKEWKRVLFIGFFWYFWHLPFLTNHNFMDNFQFFCWMVFGSWGLGRVIDSTKSIIAATCFHFIINILMFNTLIKNGIEGASKLIILGVCVAVWVVILIIWDKKNKVVSSVAVG